MDQRDVDSGIENQPKNGERFPRFYGAVSFFLPVLIMLGLYYPCLEHILDNAPNGGFNGSHIWVFDHIRAMLVGERPFTSFSPLLSYPDGALLDPLAWAPSILVAPVGQVFGPIAAYYVALFITPGVSGLSAYLLFRRLAQASPTVAAAASTPFALSPFVMGALVSGQIAKAQLWILCLPLLGLAIAMGGPKRHRGMILLALSGLAGIFTSPSLFMQLPFVLALGGLYFLLTQKGRIKGFLMGLVCAGILAGVAYPAHTYYEGSARAERIDPRFAQEGIFDVGPMGKDDKPVQAFKPANRPQGDRQVRVMVAEIQNLILPNFPLFNTAGTVAHVTFLPFPLLLFSFLLLIKRGPGRLLGLGIFLVGISLAIGETPFLFGKALRPPEGDYWTPAAFLWEKGYPLGKSGTYYRLLAMASLGLSLLFASGAATLSPKIRGIFAWSVSAMSLGAAILGTQVLWPVQPTFSLPANVARAMAKDPTPGAVLDLTLDQDNLPLQPLMKDAALHKRAIWALPQALRIDFFPPLEQTLGQVEQALKSASPKRSLQDLGYAYAILRPHPGRGRPDPMFITQQLGEPDWRSRWYQVWKLAGPDAPADTPEADTQP